MTASWHDESAQCEAAGDYEAGLCEELGYNDSIGCPCVPLSEFIEHTINSPTQESVDYGANTVMYSLSEEYTTEEFLDDMAARVAIPGAPVMPVVDLEIAGGAVTGSTISERGEIDSRVAVLELSGGDGTGAVVTAKWRLKAIRVVLQGAFASVPTVTISGGGGSGATATAVLDGNRVVEIAVTNPGNGYTSPPAITLNGAYKDGAYVAVMELETITVVSGGSDYSTLFARFRLNQTFGEQQQARRTVSNDEGGGEAARMFYRLRHAAPPGDYYRIDWIERFIPQAGVALSGLIVQRRLEGNVADNPMGGHNICLLPVSASGGGGAGASLVARVAGGSIVDLQVANGGASYASVPTLNLPVPRAGGIQALAVATMGLDRIIVTVAGSGYSEAPEVHIVGGGGSGAEAVAVLNAAGGIASISIVKTGSGYTSLPAIALVGGGGSGAAALARLRIIAATVTNAGTGYDVVLTIFDADSGTGATGTLVVDEDPLSPTFGDILAANLTNAGSGYTLPNAFLTGPGGTSIGFSGWEILPRLGIETERFYEWDGSLDPAYQIGQSASYPHTPGWFELPVPELPGYLSVEAIRWRCTP